jgi:hypothetical protein
MEKLEKSPDRPVRNLLPDQTEPVTTLVCDIVLRIIERYYKDTYILDFGDIHEFKVLPNQRVTVVILVYSKLELK